MIHFCLPKPRRYCFTTQIRWLFNKTPSPRQLYESENPIILSMYSDNPKGNYSKSDDRTIGRSEPPPRVVFCYFVALVTTTTVNIIYLCKAYARHVTESSIVDGLGNLDYEERLKRLNLPSLAFRRFRRDLIEIYKHFHHYDQDTISPSFQRRERVTHEYQRKAKDGIRGVQSNSYSRRLKAWNDQPQSVVDAKSIDSFKMKNNLFGRSIFIKID